MVDKKMPLKERLEIAIDKYRVKFGERPPTFGYEDEDLYLLLLNSLASNTEKLNQADLVKDILGLDDDAEIIV